MQRESCLEFKFRADKMIQDVNSADQSVSTCWTSAQVHLAPNRYPRHHPTTHTHTHPFNGPFSGTTQMSRYQKGKTNLDFTGARDSEWQWHQLGHMQVCTSLQTDIHASTPPLSFLQAGCPSYTQIVLLGARGGVRNVSHHGARRCGHSRRRRSFVHINIRGSSGQPALSQSVFVRRRRPRCCL